MLNAYRKMRSVYLRQFWKHNSDAGKTEQDAEDCVDEQINEMTRTQFMRLLEAYAE